MGVAVITGATKGIGRAISLALAKKGFDLLLAARDEAGLTAFATELQKEYSIEAVYVSGDLSNEKTVAEVLSKAMDLDTTVLVNNVGGYIPDSWTGELTHQLSLNLDPPIALCKGLFGKFSDSNQPSYVFNICSIAALKPRLDAVSYSISKAAMKSMTDSLREAGRAHGIRVTGIYPGSVNTASWDGIDAPKERFVQPEDIANLICTILDNSHSSLVGHIEIEPLDPSL